jgi:hypothetical protein
MVKYHIQDPNKQYGHKNLYTYQKQYRRTARWGGGLNTAWVEYQKASDSVQHSWVKNK